MGIVNEPQNLIQARRWANSALIGIVLYIVLDVVIQMLSRITVCCKQKVI